MTAANLVQYVGYQAKTKTRDYTFLVRDAAGSSREFFLSIPNDAFNSHRARFQDAAEICSIRLRRELADPRDPEQTKFQVTDADIDAYRAAHAPKSVRRFPSHKATEE